MRTLTTTSDDYVLGTYVRMYIEDIIRVTYDRCDVHMYIHCECIGSFAARRLLVSSLAP